jgi:hypothetical protein
VILRFDTAWARKRQTRISRERLVNLEIGHPEIGSHAPNPNGQMME